MTGAVLTWDTWPPCPRCGMKPWRKNHLVKAFVDNVAPEVDDANVTVCMHCAEIWLLNTRSDGVLSWRPPTNQELDILLPELDGVVRTFMENITKSRRKH